MVNAVKPMKIKCPPPHFTKPPLLGQFQPSGLVFDTPGPNCYMDNNGGKMIYPSSNV